MDKHQFTRSCLQCNPSAFRLHSRPPASPISHVGPFGAYRQLSGVDGSSCRLPMVLAVGCQWLHPYVPRSRAQPLPTDSGTVWHHLTPPDTA